MVTLISGFSLNSWLTENFPTISKPLPDYAVFLLLEQLGISQYRPSTQCSNTALYMSSAHGGWINSGNIIVRNNSLKESGCKKSETC